jgi:hypothetical protein
VPPLCPPPCRSADPDAPAVRRRTGRRADGVLGRLRDRSGVGAGDRLARGEERPGPMDADLDQGVPAVEPAAEDPRRHRPAHPLRCRTGLRLSSDRIPGRGERGQVCGGLGPVPGEYRAAEVEQYRGEDEQDGRREGGPHGRDPTVALVGPGPSAPAPAPEGGCRDGEHPPRPPVRAGCGEAWMRCRRADPTRVRRRRRELGAGDTGTEHRKWARSRSCLHVRMPGRRSW